LETAPSVLWDGVVLPEGEDAVSMLSAMGQSLEFVRDQYRHCKPMLTGAAALALLDVAGIPRTLADGSADPGMIGVPAAAAKRSGKSNADHVAAFIEALAAHRHFERETNPTPV
jgi:catalase